jgi:hypothetical protein
MRGRATLRQGIPISLQSMFVLPFAHFDSPRFPNGGAMVPIHTLKTTSNSSHQRLKPTVCASAQLTTVGRSNQVTRIFGRAFRLAAYIGRGVHLVATKIYQGGASNGLAIDVEVRRARERGLQSG